MAQHVDVKGWGFIAHAHFDNDDSRGWGLAVIARAPFAPILEVALGSGIVRYFTTGLVSDTRVKRCFFCMLYETRSIQ